jgi:alpha-D-ribose 1-methylphosphonate 5-triphosphate diphosphatase PhnM
VTDIFIDGGRALLGTDFIECSLRIVDGEISAVGADHGRGSLGLDASGLKVLPGIVDLHGDAFERQIMPRPGVDFPIDVALIDSAQILAAFRLAADGVLPLARAWDLISAAPARAAGLVDRGVLAQGRRADVILVDDEVPLRPRLVAVIAAGRLVHLTDADRLIRSSRAPRKAVAAA